MKKLLKKKVNVFGKGIPVFAIVILGLALVSAVLLPYFAQITGLVTVDQGLLVDGQEYSKAGITDVYEDFTSLQKQVFSHVHYLTNNADIGAVINLVKNYPKEEVANGITAKYYETNLRSGTLELENKDTGTWKAITGDGISATLDYSTKGNDFTYTLNAEGLSISTEYVLIYYADRQDRFVNWGGDNPGALIATIITDASGKIVGVTGITDIGMTLPHQDDWNADASPNYCNMNNSYDDFNHCYGAKIWLVPSSDYDANTKKVSWAQYTIYLYETDLLGWSETELTNPITVPASDEFDFVIVSKFPKMTYPDTYEITTQVVAA